MYLPICVHLRSISVWYGDWLEMFGDQNECVLVTQYREISEALKGLLCQKQRILDADVEWTLEWLCFEEDTKIYHDILLLSWQNLRCMNIDSMNSSLCSAEDQPYSYQCMLHTGTLRQSNVP